eukprot:TRINITY_DN17913_c0_g1_i2.p1 TRINITY_DN17913_c0_g1~~TRINITY_DN17913_c0_g1_i2.p1  ORF type:complete len:232 (-),score=10.42 TRINITY_DN17913_c0_g1_i2:67-762(-)
MAEEEAEVRSFRELWQEAQEHWVAIFPHEAAMISKRTLEFGSCVTTSFILHNTYLVWNTTVQTASCDQWLYVLCCTRIVCFLPRPRIWLQKHRSFREALDQPTPQLLREKLKTAMNTCPAWLVWLDFVYYSWLVLLPCIICFGPETEFAQKLWSHYKLWWCNTISTRLLNILLFAWLRNSKINRGVSRRVLDEHTQVIDFSSPWKWPGDAECGICLQEYQGSDRIRISECT